VLDANTTPIVQSLSFNVSEAAPALSVIGLIAFNRGRRTFGFGHLPGVEQPLSQGCERRSIAPPLRLQVKSPSNAA
jgi:hypothetical protein